MPRRTNGSKCMYPYPVYEGHFADGSVVRMSFWTPINKPIDFMVGQIHCELYKLAPVIDGFVERTDPGSPWQRVRDPHFSGETVYADPAKPRINGAKLKKAALAVVERAIINGHDMPVIPPEALRDLREALNIAA